MGYWLEPGQLGTVNGLTPERYADYGRAPTFSDTLVEVSAVPTFGAESPVSVLDA